MRFLILFMLLTGCVLAPFKAIAWNIDQRKQDGSKTYEASTHPLLANAAFERFERDESFQQFLQRSYGIASVDELFENVYGIDAGSKGRFVLHAKLTTLPEYAKIDEEFEDHRFERSVGAPIVPWNILPDGKPLKDMHAFPPPFPLLQDEGAKSISELLQAGAMVEDNPFGRTSNHFHDPVDNRGLHQAPLLFYHAFGSLLGESSVRWGLGDANAKNYFSLANAERYLYRLTAGPTSEERETAAGLHFIALGHLLHLLQDASQPAHVRNDSVVGHVLAEFPGLGKLVAREDPFEEVATDGELAKLINTLLDESESDFLASKPKAFLQQVHQYYAQAMAPEDLAELDAAIASTHANLPPLDGSGFEIEEFFDRNTQTEQVYAQGSAYARNETPEAANLGLAEFVNGEFLSDGTISNYRYASPALPTEVCDQRLPQRAVGDTKVKEIKDLKFGTYYSSPAIPHLVRCSYYTVEVTNVYGESEERQELALRVSDPAVLRDYFELLFPLAIQYQEEFMKAYFRPRLEVLALGGNRFQLVNLSPHRFVADTASLEVVYEVDDAWAGTEDARYSVPVTDCVTEDGGSVFVLEPAGPGEARGEPGSMTCAMPLLDPDDPEPAVGAKLWLVARGQHGTRGAVGTPDEYDLAPENPLRKDFVTFMAKIPPPRIAFDATTNTISRPPPQLGMDDERYDTDVFSDIFAVEVNLAGLERATEYVEPKFENLTAPIRDALGVQEVDFYSSAMRPGSSELALRTDLPFEPEVNEDNHATGVAVIDLAKSPAENAQRLATLGVLPESQQLWNASALHSLRWSPDGATLFYQKQGVFSDYTYRLRNLGNGVENGILDRIRPLDQGDMGTGWNEHCDQSNNFSAISSEELVVESHCRSTTQSNDETLVFLEDSFLRQVQLVEEDPGFSTSIPVRYFDMNAGSIVACPASGVCLSGYAPASFPAGRQPHVSPDGKRVAFLARGEGCQLLDGSTCMSWFENQLWIATLEGELAGQVQLVIENPHVDPVFYADPTNPHEYGVLSDLAWSPDGNWLAFTTSLGLGRANLYLLRIDDAVLARGVASPHLVAREISDSYSVEGTHASLTWIPGLILNRAF